MSEKTSRTPLEVRHAAALKLVKAGELDGVLALSLVVWPPRGPRLEDEQVPRERQFYADELRDELRRRHAAGETVPELAQATGVPYATVKFWLNTKGREKDVARPAGGRKAERLTLF